MSALTIKDVAARAGVSAKTVSRVINGEAHVRPAVREAVMRVVAETGYRPNAFARGLSSSRAFLVGLFFDDPSSGYAADLQRGALARCRELSYHLVVEPVDPEQRDWRDRLTATLHEIRLAGAILTPPICDNPALIELLEAHGVPMVRIAPGFAPGRTAQVAMDDRAAAREMTAMLLSIGHRDIAFITGKPDHEATPRRLEGFREAMAMAGVPPMRILDGDFSFRSGIDAADALLGGGGARPSAIFASNDEMALGVLAGALRHRVAVPGDLSIAGFDDAPIARMAWPQLTTVRQPNIAMAAAAVDMLVGSRRPVDADAPPLRLDVDYALVHRASVAARG